MSVGMIRKDTIRRGRPIEAIEEFVARIGSEFVRLIRTEKHLNVALRLAGVSAFRVDPALRYEWVFSSQFEGPDGDDGSAGKSNHELFAAEDAALLDRLYGEVFSSGLPISFDAQLTCLRTMHKHHLEMHLEPVLGEDGRIEAISGSAFNLTTEDERRQELSIERIRADEALGQAEAARRQAEHANRVKTSLMAAAGHDLRQPLQAISLFQGMVVERLQLLGDETGLKAAEAIGRALSSAEELLTALMDFAVLAAGRVEVHLSDFSADEVVAGNIGDFTDLAKRRGLRLRVLPCPVLIRSDPVLLKRIIRNLTINAIKYTDRGGVLIGCRRRGGALRIEVWDTGRGIPENKLASIFDEFDRGSDAVDSAAGLGIGLSIVAGTACLLDHEVTVRSREGKGSLFAVTVPLAEGCHAARLPGAAEHQAETPPAADSRSVLIVDDEPMVALGISVVLKDAGLAVAGIVDTGEAALKNAALSHPALALMDINLRGSIDGIEAARRLGDTLGVPVLYVTGQSDEATRVRALGIERPCGYLLKPFTAGRLIEAVRNILDHREPL